MGLIVPDCRTVGAEEDPRYKILMSKDKRLCANVREVLNDDLINYGQGYDQRKFGAPIFSAIAWTPIKGLDDGFDYVGSVSHVDLNNDGTTDVLVRLETHAGPGGSIGVHELFIFKEDQYPQLAKKRRELEGNAVGLVIPHLQKEYELRDLPQKTFRGIPGLEGRKYYETLIAAVFIHPFRFQNTTYLLMTQSPDSPAVPNWAVVGKYKKGKLREADSVLMDDICYLNLK
jgi:hypothetical protein